MSPSTEPTNRTDDSNTSDQGFSLIEVIVSFGILVMLIAAITPALVVGIRSNDVARRAQQEKGFAQTEVELMRSLPYHVAPAAGDFIDVLDRFFHDTAVPGSSPICGSANAYRAPALTTVGYVGPSGSRCSWEPPGAFYRQIRTQADDPDLGDFILVINTQFLNDNTPPTVVPPPSNYDSGVVGRDAPPTSQLGVTVSVFREGKTTGRPMTTYTQIGRRDQLDPQVKSSVDVSAVDVGTVLPDGFPITLSGGLLDLTASLTHMSRVNAVLSSTTTGVSTGQQAGGAGLTVSGPPNASVSAQTVSPGSLNASGCDLVCWGTTTRSALTVTAGDGLPNAASTGAPLKGILRSGDFTLAAGQPATLRPELALSGTLVSIAGTTESNNVLDGTTTACALSGAGSQARILSAGWLRTTAPNDAVAPSVVDACGMTGTARLSILPTTFAPLGVIRVTLENARARCTVSGPSHTPAAAISYNALIERWENGTYVEAARINETTGPDKLNDIPLSTALGGGHGTLGKYIESWSALRSSGIITSTGSEVVNVSVPGIVNIVTQPVRPGSDEGGVELVSSASITVGTLACHAEDHR